jgi:hypothetical protein
MLDCALCKGGKRRTEREKKEREGERGGEREGERESGRVGEIYYKGMRQ